MNAVNALIQKGVKIPDPVGVQIGPDVDIHRISGQNVTINTGSKISGPDTFIDQNVQIGKEGPATIENCYIGPSVALKGGFFQNTAFLEASSCGSGSHVRKGTILEEEASIAHTVGLKQTILLPFVTLGSLINFCDCLMAGGTSRRNHSEVGSSYIHFNYTPNQDKATPSLIGDVPRGVMLNQSPIFLGGQGGLVGPRRLAFGTMVAAGTICRKDHLEENQLIMESGPRTARMPYKSGIYHNLKMVFSHNFNYIANLYALNQMYSVVRRQFIGPTFPQALADGLVATLKMGIDERIKQLGRLKENLVPANSGLETLAKRFVDHWATLQQLLIDLQAFQGSASLMDQFVEFIDQQIQSHGKQYIRCIQALTAEQATIGTQWLQGIVDHVCFEMEKQLNSEG